MSRPDEGAVRDGEAFDLAAVEAWLRGLLPDLGGPAQVTQFSGGASNWTYRLRYPNHDLILRRPPAGKKAKSAHDMGREFRVQQALKPAFPLVPELVGLCEDEAVLGAPFYVMRRVDGVIPRKELAVPLRPDQARALGERFVDTLVALHRVDPVAVGLDRLGKGPGYAKRQITGWIERYKAAKTWNVPSFARVMAWLEARVPDDAGAVVIHNDYRLDNVVLDAADPTVFRGVLDWEMATVGCPLMDLGNTLSYWVQADDDPIARMTRRQPSHLPGMPGRRELVARYCAATGREPDALVFYEVYGVFRLAVILQQIYYRYHHGQTKNPAFKRYWMLVAYMAWRCGRLIRAAR